MLLFYVDECGDHSMNTVDDEHGGKRLKDGVSPYFVLSGVGIRDTSRKPLAEALFEIKERHFGEGVAGEPWGDSEIKGRYLARAARAAAAGRPMEKPAAYRALATTDQVARLVNDLGLVFDKYRPLTFSAVVDKRRVLETGRNVPPLGAAYAYLHQRVALTLEKLHAGEGAILIADQQTQHEKFFRSGEMNRVRDRLSQKLAMRPNFDLVIDKPLWVDTDLSSWDREIIQLADIVAYASYSCVETGAAPTHASHLWSHIRATMALHWRTGKVNSSGFAIYPKPDKYPAT